MLGIKSVEEMGKLKVALWEIWTVETWERCQVGDWAELKVNKLVYGSVEGSDIAWVGLMDHT